MLASSKSMHGDTIHIQIFEWSSRKTMFSEGWKQHSESAIPSCLDTPQESWLPRRYRI